MTIDSIRSQKTFLVCVECVYFLRKHFRLILCAESVEVSSSIFIVLTPTSLRYCQANEEEANEEEGTDDN
jgi:hypothetical protein